MWLLGDDRTIPRGFDRAVIRGRSREFLGAALAEEVKQILFKFSGKIEEYPTTGAVVLLHLIRSYPDAFITLFGFTHEGWKKHAWDAEAAWVDDLIEQGRVFRTPVSGDLAAEPVTEIAYREIVRSLRFVRRLRSRSSRSERYTRR
jgi:hypothetical protein